MGMNRALGTTLAALALVAAPARGQETPAEEAETCLSCHADPQLSTAFKDGASRSLFVDGAALAHVGHQQSIVAPAELLVGAGRKAPVVAVQILDGGGAREKQLAGRGTAGEEGHGCQHHCGRRFHDSRSR